MHVCMFVLMYVCTVRASANAAVMPRICMFVLMYVCTVRASANAAVMPRMQVGEFDI